MYITIIINFNFLFEYKKLKYEHIETYNNKKQ